MPLDEVLARCLAAMEQGDSVETCLAHFPTYAEELEPLLRIAASIHSGPAPQLSPAAFARGRAAVAAHARYHQSLRAPFDTMPLPIPVADAPRFETPALRMPPPKALRPKAPFHRLTSVLVSLFILLIGVTAARQVSASLPGSPAYTTKVFFENVQGALMTAAGQEASWHVRQVRRRFYELDQLARQGAPADVALIAEIERNVQAALESSTRMTDADRGAFLTQWLDDLNRAPASARTETTVVTLGRVLASIKAATGDVSPTVLPVILTPTPSATPSPTDSPAPSATASEAPTQALVPLPTPTYTPLPQTPAAANTADPGGAPPATATTVLDFDDSNPPAPVATIVVIQPEPDDEERSEEQNDPPPSATNTVAPPATATTMPTATWTPLPTATDTNTPTVTASASVTSTESAETPDGTRTPEATPSVGTETPSPAPGTETSSPTTLTPTTGTMTPTPAIATPETTTPVASVTASPEQTATASPEATPSPGGVNTETPMPPTNTVQPSPTPLLTATPTRDESPATVMPTATAPPATATPEAETREPTQGSETQTPVSKEPATPEPPPPADEPTATLPAPASVIQPLPAQP